MGVRKLAAVCVYTVLILMGTEKWVTEVALLNYEFCLISQSSVKISF